jgi:thiol-disulfide isomerase/thioredoxin
MSDTVYHRSIEILKQKKNGSFIENPSMGEIIKSGHWAINIISYEAKKGNYQNAKIYNNPFYFQLIPFYEQLHEVYKRYALGFAHRKANIHLALNEKDSALQVYTELAKLTQADTIFDKIKAVYLEIHGSDSAYKDFLKKNGIDKFHKEKKYAPNAEFLMYGNDEKINIESLRGKVVVLNFWGTYCKPCIKEMPDLNNLKLRYLPEKDLVFIAPTKDDAAKLKSFFKNKKFDYQIAYTSEEVFKAFNVSFIPVNMVINRKGEIIFEESGAYQDTLLKLNRAIEEALYSR